MDSPPARRFGLLLALHRMRAGLSQGECAAMVGMYRAEVSLIERGGRQPQLDTLLALAAAVGVGPGELLVGIRWSPTLVEATGEYVVDPPVAGGDA